MNSNLFFNTVTRVTEYSTIRVISTQYVVNKDKECTE